MASIQKRKTRAGSKIYVVRWRDTGGKDKSKSFRTDKEAKAYRGEVDSTLAKGTYVDPGASKVTLRVHSTEWLKMSQAAPATKAKYKSLLDSHILPSLGDLKVAEMNPVRVKRLLAERSKKGYAPRTVRNVAEVLASLSHAAVDNGLLAKDWMPRRLDLPRPKADERVFLTHEQVADLVEHTPDIYKALVLTAAYSGMRWSEVAGLKANRIDFKKKTIDVVQALTYNNGARFETLKSGASRRTLQVPDKVIEAIEAHLETYGEGQDRVVFHSPRRGLLRDDNFRPRVWVPATKAAKTVPDNMHFHDLRHTCASILIHAGWDVTSVSRYLGHSNPAVTLKVYIHVFESVQRRNLDSLNEAIADAALPE